MRRPGTCGFVVLRILIGASPRRAALTPLIWDEVEHAVDCADAGGLVFEIGDVLGRVAGRGDLFQAVPHPADLPDLAR
jgi:hypothetical protein